MFHAQQKALICNLQKKNGTRHFCAIPSSQDDICEDSYWNSIHSVHFD